MCPPRREKYGCVRGTRPLFQAKSLRDRVDSFVSWCELVLRVKLGEPTDYCYKAEEDVRKKEDASECVTASCSTLRKHVLDRRRRRARLARRRK